jgi:hypothetical protein
MTMHQVGPCNIFSTGALSQSKKASELAGCPGSTHPAPYDPQVHSKSAHPAGDALGVALSPGSGDISPKKSM